MNISDVIITAVSKGGHRTAHLYGHWQDQSIQVSPGTCGGADEGKDRGVDWNRGAQITGDRSPWRLNFVR